MYNFKKFSRGFTPRTPLKRKGSEREEKGARGGMGYKEMGREGRRCKDGKTEVEVNEKEGRVKEGGVEARE
jgi:hypothetical protein